MSKNFKEFVETFEILKDAQCFWGKMSREEAKQILADKPIGSYLIFEILVIDENRGIQNFEMIKNASILVKEPCSWVQTHTNFAA